MDPKLGAFWKPDKKSEKGPIGKGNLDLSRLEAADLQRVLDAIKKGEKIKATLWHWATKPKDTAPDFSISLDAEYHAPKKEAAMAGETFADDIPF
jgi:hypothetical protein